MAKQNPNGTKNADRLAHTVHIVISLREDQIVQGASAVSHRSSPQR